MPGSGLFKNRKALKEHLVPPGGQGGIAAEVADLRADIANVLAPMANIVKEEFVNVPAASTTGFKTAHATTTAAGKAFTPASGFDGTAPTGVLPYPRQVTVTTGGTTAADALNTPIVVEGTDAVGRKQTETIAAAGTAATVTTTRFFKTVTRIGEGASPGAGATLAFGFAAPIGLSYPILTVQGNTSPIKEIAIGATVTTGSVAAASVALPFGSYTPAAAANGTNDYALYYDADGSFVPPAQQPKLQPPEAVYGVVRYVRYGL